MVVSMIVSTAPITMAPISVVISIISIVPIVGAVIAIPVVRIVRRIVIVVWSAVVDCRGSEVEPEVNTCRRWARRQSGQSNHRQKNCEKLFHLRYRYVSQ